jgi:hypothetical protein
VRPRQRLPTNPERSGDCNVRLDAHRTVDLMAAPVAVTLLMQRAPRPYRSVQQDAWSSIRNRRGSGAVSGGVLGLLPGEHPAVLRRSGALGVRLVPAPHWWPLTVRLSRVSWQSSAPGRRRCHEVAPIGRDSSEPGDGQPCARRRSMRCACVAARGAHPPGRQYTLRAIVVAAWDLTSSRRLSVRGPARPSWVIPASSWKHRTAASVASPNLPSMPVRPIE